MGGYNLTESNVFTMKKFSHTRTTHSAALARLAATKMKLHYPLTRCRTRSSLERRLCRRCACAPGSCIVCRCRRSHAQAQGVCIYNEELMVSLAIDRPYHGTMVQPRESSRLPCVHVYARVCAGSMPQSKRIAQSLGHVQVVRDSCTWSPADPCPTPCELRKTAQDQRGVLCRSALLHIKDAQWRVYVFA